MKIFGHTATAFRQILSLCLFSFLISFPLGDPGDAQAGSPHAADVPSGTFSQEQQTSRPTGVPDGVCVSERLFGLPGLKKVGRVAQGVYRGAQPTSEGYATLKKMGIRTIVNLRTTESEKKAVEAAGMKSVEIPLGMFNNGDAEKVDKIVAVMADPSNRPVFVHCKLGQDRTGVVVAAYRMKIEQWPLRLAEAEMESFGFNGVWVNLRNFLHRYAAGMISGNRTIVKTARE